MKIEDFVKEDKLKEIVFARRKGDQFAYVLQYEPQVRSIMVTGGYKQINVVPSQKQSFFSQTFAGILPHIKPFTHPERVVWRQEADTAYRLAFPYLIFVVNFKGRRYDKTAVAVRNEPLKTIDDNIYRLPLSNIYRFPDGLGLCMDFHGGLAGAGDMDAKWGTTRKLRAVVDNFWFTRFGGTRAYYHQQKVDPLVQDYDEWEKNTEGNPDFITTVKWDDPGWTIKELIDTIGGSYLRPLERELSDWEKEWDEWNKEQEEEWDRREEEREKKRLKRRMLLMGKKNEGKKNLKHRKRRRGW